MVDWLKAQNELKSQIIGTHEVNLPKSTYDRKPLKLQTVEEYVASNQKSELELVFASSAVGSGGDPLKAKSPSNAN